MADMTDAADWPDEGVEIDCNRAFDTPETGSAFEDGQSPRAGFFLGPQPPWSPFIIGDAPFV